VQILLSVDLKVRMSLTVHWLNDFSWVTAITAEVRRKASNSPIRQRGFSFPAGNEDQVTTSQGSLPTTEVCARIRQFGYAASQRIRIYGEEFEVLSDPFPSDGGIAIEVRSKRTAQARVLQLPATIIHRVSQNKLRAA
jgi:hypothetical protein